MANKTHNRIQFAAPPCGISENGAALPSLVVRKCGYSWLDAASAAMAPQSAAIFLSVGLGGGPGKDDRTPITISQRGAIQSHWPNRPLQASVTGEVADADESRRTWNALRNVPPGDQCAWYSVA